jgi:hypothetical protein
MQTLVAYVALNPLPDDEVTRRMARVDRIWDELWTGDVVAHHGALGQRAGVCLWDLKDSVSRWPSFETDAGMTVASLYAPIGYEAVVGDVDPTRAPLSLARRLIDEPQRIHALTAPFVFAAIDHQRESFHLHNDALGLGRLFQCRAPFGWVWSNRPSAALTFGGVRAAPDSAGWSVFAASGWFMGDRTPFDGVSAVPPGSVIGYGASDGRVEVTRQSFPAPLLPGWASTGRSLDDRLDETATALTNSARSVYHLYNVRPTLDLSGGRDSRLVSAVFLSAGLDAGLQTDGTIAGEAQTARHLVALFPGEVQHTVTESRSDQAAAPDALSTPMAARAFLWHRYADGLRMSSYLPLTPPASASSANLLTVGGAGGEVAHGHFYPSSLSEILDAPAEQLPDRISRALAARICARIGPTPLGRALLSGVVDQVVRDGSVAGLDGATLFDWFWLQERLRRWGGAAERAGIVAPLLSPEFLRAALAMTKEQRVQSALHRKLIARLVPEWADVPFFTPGPGDVRVVTRPRIWEPPDREVLEAVIANEGVWSDHFDVSAVQGIWSRVLAGDGTPVIEVMLQRVVWYSAFVAYLDYVNGADTGLLCLDLPPEPEPTEPEPASEEDVPAEPAPADAVPTDAEVRARLSFAGFEPPTQFTTRVSALRRHAARILRGLARRVDRTNR